MPGADPLDVSVVVPTCRRPDLLGRLFDALEAQTLDPSRFEVVVCDDGGDDRAWAVLAERTDRSPLRVRLLRHDRNRGAAAARNTGWRAATAPLVAFTDDDCAPAPGWLEAGLAAIGDDDVLQGRVAPWPDEEPLALGPFARTIRVEAARYFETCNVFYRRDALEAVGGFSEDFGRGGGEDTDLALRVVASGRTAGFAPDALVHHRVRPSSLRATLRETPRWHTLVLVVRRHPEVRTRFLHRRVFWKRSHPYAAAAVVGLAAAVGRRRPWAAALALPWVWYRLDEHPLTPALADRVVSLPGALVVDAYEIVAMARGSVRYRTLVL